MALLGELAVNLVARTTKFDKGLKNAHGGLNKFKTSAEKTKKSIGLMKSAVVGLGTAFVGGIISRNILDTAAAIDELGKKSDLLGLTTEALGGLRHAAEQTGVTSDTLDMALQRMVRRVAEAATGTGEAKDALAELGLSAEKLATLDADEQFKQIADAMNQVTDQSAKVRLGFKLFDSEGVKLINTLKLGSDGIERMQTEAEKLGLTVSGEDAKRMEKFNDEMDRLSKFFTGGKQQLVISIGPAALSAVEDLNQILSDIKPVVDLLAGPERDGQERRTVEGSPAFRFMQQVMPFGGFGRDLGAAMRIMNAQGGGVIGPAAQPSEMMSLPGNFRDARVRRTPGELRELRIAELKELRRESKQAKLTAEQQRQELIDAVRSTTTPPIQQQAANTIGP